MKRRSFLRQTGMIVAAVTMPTIRSFGATGLPAEDIIIADFTGDTWPEGWIVEGTAFGSPLPTKTSRKRIKPTENHRQCWDGAMSSPEFGIERDYINIKVCGVLNPGQCYISVFVKDKEVRRLINFDMNFKLWRTIDVKGLKGKQARLEVHDKYFNGWVDIDMIVQSDTAKHDQPNTDVPVWRETVFEANIGEKKYLLLPIAGNAPTQDLTIEIDGKKILTFPFTLAQQETKDFLPVYYVGGHKGKTLRVHYFETENSMAKQQIKLSNQMPQMPERRPAFHITNPYGGLNDPNGLVYYDGEYHLFHQYRFGGLRSVFWYHFVSTDLVNWKQLPIALFPDKTGAMFSGSGVVDWFNTGWFQTGKEKAVVVFATGSKGWGHEAPYDKIQTQNLAFSNDRGRTFTKYEGNPVLGEERTKRVNARGNSRDPKVIWYSPTRGMDYKAKDGHWVMLLAEEKGGTFFVSKDLKEWEQTQVANFGGECPEFFEIAVDGNPNDTRWVAMFAGTRYHIGTFDGRVFTAEESKELNAGKGFYYAEQTFNNTEGVPPRRIQMAWQGPQLSFPVELNLRTTDDGLHMYALPVEEIKNLYVKTDKLDGITITENSVNPLKDFDKGLYDIEMEIDLGTAKVVEFNIRGKEYVYDVSTSMLTTPLPENAKELPVLKVPHKDNKLTLRFLTDHWSIELFAQDGRYFIPMGFRKGPNDVEISSTDIGVNVKGGSIVMKRCRI
nr:glycoside hydrolase family 32 protein [Planctomycetota bacterium]